MVILLQTSKGRDYMSKMRLLRNCIVLAIMASLISPEVFLEPTLGCVERIDGKEITIDESFSLISEMYKGTLSNKLRYKLKILELIRSMDQYDKGCISINPGATES